MKSSEEPSSINELLLSENRSVNTGTECFVEAVAQVSKANGLSELWAQPEAVIKSHLNSWAQCPAAGNKLKQTM